MNNVDHHHHQQQQQQQQQTRTIPTQKSTNMKSTKTPSIKQYHDEKTGFVVHIEDGIIWVRI
jgi:hypothetical protein